MVQSCCELCYAKYLSNDENKVIDESFLLKNFGNNYSIVKELTPIQESWKEFLLSKGHDLPTSTYVIVGEVKTELCMCECHIHGLHVFH